MLGSHDGRFFAVLGNNIFLRQKVLEFADVGLANRILVRIEDDLDFRLDRPYAMAVIGELQLSRRRQDIMLDSAFHRPWSQVAIFRFLGFYFDKPTEEQWGVARQYAAKHSPWPAAEGVEVMDDLIIVLLPE